MPLALLFVLVLAVILPACGAGRSTMAPAAHAGAAPFAGLPAPSEALKQAAYTDSFRTRLGSDRTYIGGGYDDHTVTNGDNVQLNPQWNWGGAHSILDTARTAFQFNVTDYFDTPTIEMNWVTAPDYANLWLGMANWGKDRWDWFHPTGSVLDLGDLTPYSGASGVMVAVVLLGQAPAELAWVRLGPELWKIEVVDNAGDVGRYSSLALDSSDQPHIAYYDTDNTSLKYASYDGSAWQKETVDNTSDMGKNASLALDSTDKPHICYMDYTNTALMYAYHDGSAWQFETVDNTGNVGYSCSMVLDSADLPHIAHYDADAAREKYASFDGTLWHYKLLADANMASDYSSIVLDAAENPHIAFLNGPNTIYAYYDGAIWNYETVATDSRVTHGPRSLALDSTGVAHVFLYGLIDGFAYYASRTGGTWSIDQIPGLHNYGTNMSLALGADDTPHVSCYGLGLEYLEKPDADWHIVDVDTSSWTGHFTSLALDSAGRPRISYYCPQDKTLCYARYVD